MDANRWKKIDDLVDAALEVSERGREEFVTERAGDDDELRKEVLDLLRAQTDADEFLNNSAMQIVAKALAGDEPPIKSASLVGQKIATYRIEKLLGAGGMGEVYLAFDEKMRRKVALKILPAEYGTSDERVRRFEIEARAVSSINHPNIVTIYDVGNSENINYIATEFVEGKTLRDLMDGKFNLRNVMANAIQLCDALSAAHEVGVIHRDIKPENIMIRKDGYAKILDFGVAKLIETALDKTRALGNTTKGIIIGTPAYMSPAQIAGDTVDHRTDIWSCGVVLYEFLTGKNPFKGTNRQATFHAILSEEVQPPSSLNPEIPPELDQILRKILRKDPDVSYQSAADLRADLRMIKRELDSSASSSSGEFSGSIRTVKTRSFEYWPMVAGLFAVAVIVLFLGIFSFRNNSPKSTEWTAAKNVQLTFQSGTEAYPSLSPDGKSFVYTGGETGSEDIFLLRIGGTNAVNLTPDSKETDMMPAFSPDGERIAFRSNREPSGIYIMGATGENARRVLDFGYSPAWSPDGKYLVVASRFQNIPAFRIASAIWIVEVETGEKQQLIDQYAMQPSWSPDGKRIAFWHIEKQGIRIVSTMPAAGGEVVDFAGTSNTNWNPQWSPDGKYLYYTSDRSGNMAIWRGAIDTATGESIGDHDAVPTPGKLNRHLGFSRGGNRLIYVQTEIQANIKTAPFDPKTEKITAEPSWVTKGDFEFSLPELSPDGKKFVAKLVRKTREDIVTLNVDGSGMRDLTDDAAFDRYPRWSHDGRRLVFATDRTGNYELWTMNGDGTEMRQITDIRENFAAFPIWSPSGQRVAYDSGERVFVIEIDKTLSAESAEMLPLGENNKFFRMWDWSPDGSKAVGLYQGSSDPGIGFYTFATQKYERITDYNSGARWLPDSRRIVFTRDNKVFIADTITKQVRPLLPEIKDRVGFADISHDGKLFYYTTADSESDIWLLDLAENP